MNLNVMKTITGFKDNDRSNELALIEYLGISRDDIVKANWSSSLYYPAYVIALDHGTQNIVISVRGTMSVQDIITDINNLNVDFTDGRVHGGINRAAKNVYNDIIESLVNLMTDDKYKNYGFRFVGHSLGAAVVSIITHIFFEDYSSMISKTKTYCYGCPPIFSENIAEKWSSNIITIVNNKDIIPRLSVGEQLYLPGIILHYNKSTKTFIGRNKEYFAADNIIGSSLSEHLPNRYAEVTKKF
jgi:predicted lipase